MKVLNYTLLIALFLLIGNSISSSVSLLCLLLLVGTNLIVVKKGKIKVPLYFYLTLAIYLIFLTIGLFYGHREPQIDIKFQLFGFLFYLFLLNKKEFNVLPILLIINYIVLGVYLSEGGDQLMRLLEMGSSSIGVDGGSSSSILSESTTEAIVGKVPLCPIFINDSFLARTV